ncbi:MAG: phage integrase N-terminal SAM-like domain-containing protein [Candidatus Thiodiazotropha sp.]
MAFGGKSWGQPSVLRKLRLLDQVRIACRQKHFSHRTEKSYVSWIRQFILFNAKRPVQKVSIGFQVPGLAVCLPFNGGSALAQYPEDGAMACVSEHATKGL